MAALLATGSFDSTFELHDVCTLLCAAVKALVGDIVQGRAERHLVSARVRVNGLADMLSADVDSGAIGARQLTCTLVALASILAAATQAAPAFVVYQAALLYADLCHRLRSKVFTEWVAAHLENLAVFS